MHKLYHWLLPALLAVVLISCDSDSRSSKIDTRTPAKRFQDDQANIKTTHGKVVDGSAQDTKDGKIEYKTEDGTQWRVPYSKRADGTQQYGTPKKVE